MLKRLRAQFVCFNMLIVTAMLCAIFGLVIYFTGEALEAESLQVMEQILDTSKPMGRLREDPDRQIRLPYFCVEVSRGGEIIAAFGNYIDMPEEADLLRIVSSALSLSEEQGVLKEYDLRFYRRSTPVGIKIAFADVSGAQSALRSLFFNCLGIGILSFAAFFALSLFLARWAVKPVDIAWQQQKQFVADASHELKTPLTVIMTNAELLQSPDYTPEDRAKFAGSILTVSRQMRGLVENLLELARVDNGAVKTAFTEVALSELVWEGILPFEPLYFEKGLGLTSRIEPGIRVRGSESHLAQVTEILLDNAMKYSAPGGTVHIGLARHGGHAVLTVSNPGDPISREDLSNIFKRFYRVDKVRARSGSYGLGLSIAQRIVEEHSGKIRAESTGGINTFSVQLSIL